MGLLPWLLAKIFRKKAVPRAYSWGKLAVRCVQTGPRPLRIAEKIGMFFLDRRSATLAWGYYIIRIAVSKQRTQNDVERAMNYTGDPVGVEAHGMTVQDVGAVLRLLEEVEDVKSLAGFTFVQVLMGKQAVDSSIRSRYGIPGGRFNVCICLAEFYSSPCSLTFRDVTVKGARAGWPSEHKQKLTSSASRVWNEIQTRAVANAIDLLVL